MKIMLSPLKLIDLSVVNLVCHFIAPRKQVDAHQLFEGYEVDINFGLKVCPGNSFQLYLKVGVNYNQPVASQKEGYALFIEGVGNFYLEEDIKNRENSMHLTNAALAMTLNFLRTKLADYTAHFPLGMYFMPNMDLNDLLVQKQKKLALKKKTAKK